MKARISDGVLIHEEQFAHVLRTANCDRDEGVFVVRGKIRFMGAETVVDESVEFRAAGQWRALLPLILRTSYGFKPGLVIS